MKRIAVFPGSFDPVTIGHVDIVQRAVDLFDEVVVAIGINTQKKYMFDLDTRLKWLAETFKEYPNVRVDHYEGLTTNYCQEIGAQFMLRGLRSSVDFEYERSIAQMSKELDYSVETVLLFTSPKYSAINSSVVRELIKNNGKIDSFVPKTVQIP